MSDDLRIVNLPGDDDDGAGAADVDGDLAATVEAGVLSATDAGMANSGIGNAERFVEKYEGQALFVKAWGHYLLWDGKRWRLDEMDAATEWAKTVAVDIFAQAPAGEAGIADRKWAVRTASGGGLAEMLDLASSDPAFAREPKDFDAESYVLNVDNGVIDLRTGELREHRQSDMMSKISPAVYKPGAKSEVWTKFIETAVPDKDVRGFIQRAAGSALIGDPADQRLYLVQGPGATGKSTFLNAIRYTLGEYAGVVDPESLLQKKGDAGIRNDLAALPGLRFVISVEPTEGKGWDAERIKQITGGDPFKVRKLFHEPFEFTPQLVLFIGCNEMPPVPASNLAFWRRMTRIVFDTIIPEAKRDRDLPRKLRRPEVMSAILAWLVEGCLAYQTSSVMVLPRAVREATEEYQRDNDPLLDWLAERCDIGEDYTADAKSLWQSYQSWLLNNGNPKDGVKQGKDWTRVLTAKGFTPERDKGKRERLTGWRGLRLRSAMAMARDAAPLAGRRN